MADPRNFTPEQVHRRRYLIAMTVTLAAMMELLDTSIVNVAITQIMGNMGATLEEVTWVSTGYIVANVIVLPISGWLSRYFGRRRYFMGSIMLFVAASFFCGNASSLEALVFWRIVQGIGGGGLLSTAQASLYEIFPPSEMGTSMAIFGLGVMMGPTLGPTVGGYITYHYSWPWIFYINLPIGLFALWACWMILPDSRFASDERHSLRDVDWWGIALIALFVGALQLLLERGERLQWFDSGEILSLGVVSATAFLFFIWHERRVNNPVVDLGILRDRQFAAGLAFSYLLGMALFTTVFYLPLYLQSSQGYNAMETGMVILPGALANGFTMAMLGKFVERVRIDLRLLAIIGIGIFTASMYLHGQLTTDSGNDDVFWPVVLRGVGLGFLFIPLNALAMANISVERMPNATGIYTLVRHLGGSVGIAWAATQYVHYQQQFRNELTLHLDAGNAALIDQMHYLRERLTQSGLSPEQVQQALWQILDGRVLRQAAMLGFEHLFLLFSFLIIGAIPLLLLMPRARDIHQDRPVGE